MHRCSVVYVAVGGYISYLTAIACSSQENCVCQKKLKHCDMHLMNGAVRLEIQLPRTCKLEPIQQHIWYIGS